jgi:hypothetical protein
VITFGLGNEGSIVFLGNLQSFQRNITEIDLLKKVWILE